MDVCLGTKSIDHLKQEKKMNKSQSVSFSGLEEKHFPFNSSKDFKKIANMTKLLKSNITTVVTDPFYEDFENKINFVVDSRLLPNIRSKFVDSPIQQDNNLAFKEKLEKIEHPNAIHPSALVQINKIRKLKQNKKDEEKIKTVEQYNRHKNLTSNDKLEKTINSFKKQLADQYNKCEDMQNFFKYKIDSYENVFIQSGRIKQEILDIN